MSFRDKSGRELLPGDYIVYGHALGRCAGLRYGKVLEVYTPKPDKWSSRVYTDKIKIIGVDDDWDHRATCLLSKPSNLAFGSRVLWLDRHQMPVQVYELLRWYEP